MPAHPLTPPPHPVKTSLPSETAPRTPENETLKTANSQPLHYFHPPPCPWLRFPTSTCKLPAQMELDLIEVQFDLRAIKPRELEEVLEDPFSVRFLPDADRSDGASRYYALGRTVADRHLFLSFWTDGKITRVVAAREMTEGEQRFYDRKYAEFR